MSIFRSDIMAKIEAQGILVQRMGRESAKWWNQRRKADDVRLFCGWYWLKGTLEGGPFPTPSSAYRDAYYKFVLNRDPPTAIALPKNVVKIGRKQKVA